MLELKEYLQARGVTVTGYLKPALVEIANAVQKMMLPLDPNFECRNDSERKLIIHENEIEDPFWTLTMRLTILMTPHRSDFMIYSII